MTIFSAAAIIIAYRYRRRLSNGNSRFVSLRSAEKILRRFKAVASSRRESGKNKKARTRRYGLFLVAKYVIMVVL